MNFTVLGCGRWGTYIAHYLNSIGHEVLLWGRKDSKRMKTLIATGGNEYLKLDKNKDRMLFVVPIMDSSDIIFISINSQQLRNLAENISKFPAHEKTLVLCMKGIENKTGFRLTEVIDDVCENRFKTAVWVGPGHVQNFLNGIPSCMIIDSASQDLSRKLAEQFSSDLIRIYYGSDIVGTEIGAAAKNVVGIAAGMLDGLGYHSLTAVSTG